MKLIEIGHPFMGVKLCIHNIDADENATLDTGFSSGINAPLKYRNSIIKEARIRGKRIFKLPITVADGRKYNAFVTECDVQINNKKINTTLTCMGKKFLIGREVIKQIMEDPFLAIKGEKLEVTI